MGAGIQIVESGYRIGIVGWVAPEGAPHATTGGYVELSLQQRRRFVLVFLKFFAQKNPDEPFQASLPAQPDRPVYQALRSAWIEKSRQCVLLSIMPYEQVIGDKAMTQLIRDLDELFRWLEPNFVVSQSDAVHLAHEAQEAGFSEEIVKLISESAGIRPQGRPATRRAATLAALERRHDNNILPRNRSWAALAQKLCPCGKQRHDMGCKENLRRAVVHLQKTLKRLGIAIS